jgi:hypothetical protein
MSQFKMLQVVPNEPVSLGAEALEQPDCDLRFPAAAVLPKQGLWFIAWLQKRVKAANPGRSIVYRELKIACAQLVALTDALEGWGAGFDLNYIPFKMFLKLEGKLTWSTGDWLDCMERHSFLQNEVIQALSIFKKKSAVIEKM